MEEKQIQNSEDFVSYILQELHKKVHPVKFGEFFMEISPSCGIESFRNLLEELHENGLVTKQAVSRESSPFLPGLHTVDLRFGISLRGIQYLKENTPANSQSQKIMKEVFVTYSWDTDEHNDKVIAFTNELRDQGFDAEMDKLYSQKESAADFGKMMHQAMTDYMKVIVILSKGYKEKAEKFKGGVGNEYNLILKDIEEHKNKYVLVSFEGIHDEYIPLNFKGREIVDLSDRKNLNILFAKLMDEDLVQFSEVGKQKPIIQKKVVAPFHPKLPENLQIGRLLANTGNTSQFAQLYTKIEFSLTLELKNETNQTFSEYTVEVAYPQHAPSFDANGRNENGFKIITYDKNPKLFPGQTRSLALETITIRYDNAATILNSSIRVSVYTDAGTISHKFWLKEILMVRTMYGESPLTTDLFQDRNYR